MYIYNEIQKQNNIPLNFTDNLTATILHSCIQTI